MSKLLAIGEALIDWIPGETGKSIKEVSSFSPKVGGAPANVCGVFSKMGQKSQMITQLGMDPFGDKIIDEFAQFGIGSDYVKRTTKANTSLAFVALQENGDREFSFYRNPGADMLLEAKDVKKEWFADADVLHFCSVSLGEFPMKEAHRTAIGYAKEDGMLISFDPNLRFALWEDLDALKATVKEFMPMANIVKISDEELEFITGKTSIEEAREELFQGETQIVIYTKGSKGAEVYTKNAKAEDPGYSKDVLDTTGAGDAFIGSFLYQLARDGVTVETLSGLDAETLREYIEYSNRFCAKSVTRHGAIASYPDQMEMKEIWGKRGE